MTLINIREGEKWKTQESMKTTSTTSKVIFAPHLHKEMMESNLVNLYSKQPAKKSFF